MKPLQRLDYMLDAVADRVARYFQSDEQLHSLRSLVMISSGAAARSSPDQALTAASSLSI